MTPMDQQRFMQQFGMYNKVQDRIMMMGNNAFLNMNLMLYSDSEKYGRRYYYKEFKYVSEKAGGEVKKLLREYDAYMSLENIKPVNNIKEFIVIRGRDLELMRMALLPKLESIIQNFDTIYEMRGKKMYISDSIKPFQIDVNNKPLIFLPGIRKMYTEELLPCVDVYLNGNPENVVSMSFNQVYEFMYIVRTFQIQLYAASMLAYLGRPMPGTNMINMTDGQAYDQVSQMELPSPKGRYIEGRNPYKNESYFGKKENKKE